MTKRQIEILFKSINNFGIFNGLDIIRKLRRIQEKSEKNEIQVIRINKYDLNVFLRKGTSDPLVFIEIFIDEVYKLDEPDVKINTIIDAGANIGLTALYYSCKFPEANIFALEPEINNFNLLVKNTRQRNSIKPLNMALNDSDGFVNMSNTEAGEWGFKLERLEMGNVISNKVVGLRMQTLIKNENIDTIDILKIDIEGAEKYILNDEASYLTKTKFMFIELHPNVNGSVASFINCLKTYPPYYIKGKGENLILKYL